MQPGRRIPLRQDPGAASVQRHGGRHSPPHFMALRGEGLNAPGRAAPCSSRPASAGDDPAAASAPGYRGAAPPSGG
jgi:hypothetical protein